MIWCSEVRPGNIAVLLSGVFGEVNLIATASLGTPRPTEDLLDLKCSILLLQSKWISRRQGVFHNLNHVVIILKLRYAEEHPYETRLHIIKLFSNYNTFLIRIGLYLLRSTIFYHLIFFNPLSFQNTVNLSSQKSWLHDLLVLFVVHHSQLLCRSKHFTHFWMNSRIIHSFCS